MQFLFKQKRFNQKISGYSLIELILALSIALFVLAALYQITRTNWRELSRHSETGQLAAEKQRVFAAIDRLLRSCGYNPKAVPFSVSNSQYRFGILEMSTNSLTCSRDLNENSRVDTDEIFKIAVQDRNLLISEASVNQGRPTLLTQGVDQFRFTFYDDSGSSIKPKGLPSDPKTTRTVRRVELYLKLRLTIAGRPVVTDGISTVSLRNPAFLTPAQAP